MANGPGLCVCGRVPAIGDLFCAKCGLALKQPQEMTMVSTLGPTVDDSLGDDLLIGGTGNGGVRSVQSDSEVKSTDRLRWILLGLAGLGVLIFGLAQWPKSETPPQSAAETDAETDDSPETSVPRTTLARDRTSAPSTTVRGTIRSTEPGSETDDETDKATQPVGPLLGETTGLGLITRAVTGELRLTDLDTGEIVEYSIRGRPIGVIGNTVITQTDNGAVRLTDLRSPDAEEIRLVQSNGRYHQIVSVEEDVFRVISDGPTSDLPTIEAYNTKGDLVDEFPLEAEVQLFSFYSGGGSIDLLQSSGGIYRRDGSGYQQVANGSLMTSSDGLALVRRCDERMRCQATWYDRSDWDQPLDIPVPEVGQRGQIAIVGGDRWLIHTDWTDGMTEVIEIASGRVARTLNTPPSFGASFGIPISPDGRWLLDRQIARTFIVDMESGVEHDIDLGRGFLDGQGAVFVDMDDLDLN